MDGMSANFPGGNATAAANMLYQNIPNNSLQPPNINNSAPEINPKKQAVFDRLEKRLNIYRKRQNESIPRFDQTFIGICERESVETNILQKRFIESKAKRVAKKADKKQTDVTPANVTVTQSKQLKRPSDLEIDNETPSKIPSTGSADANMKFQVEMQLEFTTSVANLQPQQISTNVTVKAAMANGNVKYEQPEIKGMKMEPGKMQQQQAMQQQQQQMPQIQPQDILQDFKQEPDNEFADLDFGGLANFMANDENELKKLFSNISDVFDQDLFDQDKQIKQEPRPPQNIPQQMPQQNLNHLNQLNQQQFNQYVMPESCQMQKTLPQMHNQLQNQQQQQQRMYQQQQQQQQQQPQISEMSPAAQTLKNMAQQHQNSMTKNTMPVNYMRPMMHQQPIVQQMNQQQAMPQQRLPYQQVPQQPPQPQQQQHQFNDYQQFNKNQMQMPFTPDMIKQEMMMQQQPMMTHVKQQQPMMSHQMMVHQTEEVKNQQYQQYQTNPQFLPNHQQHQQRNNFNPNQNSMNIHMKQSQQVQFTNQGGNMQMMQGGQSMHFAMSRDRQEPQPGPPGGQNMHFEMQQQQNMYFNNQYGNMQAMQKRPMGGADPGPNNTYNMMQSQSMSFKQ